MSVQSGSDKCSHTFINNEAEFEVLSAPMKLSFASNLL